MATQLPKKSHGVAHVFTFPFPIFVEDNVVFSPVSIHFDGLIFRFYPLFRSGPGNWKPVPPLDLRRIPFTSQFKIPDRIVEAFPITAMLPNLFKDKDGQFGLRLIRGKGNDIPLLPADSLRVDVLRYVSDTPSPLCEELVNSFIERIRFETKQYWIGTLHTPSYLSATFQVTANGDPIGPHPSSYCWATSASGNEKPLSPKIFRKSLAKVEAKESVERHWLSWLDAKTYVAQSEIRNAIFAASLACETARDFYFEKLWTDINPGKKFSLGKVLTGRDLRTHISTDLLRLTKSQHSYENHDVDGFRLIGQLWIARGNIAHGRDAYVELNGGRVKADQNITKTLIVEVEKLLIWFEKSLGF